MIETKNLTKIYNHNVVVDHVNLSVKKGEIISILGPNGAGKSTIFNLLTTLVKADEGKAYINDIDVFNKPVSIKTKIGVVPQEYAFYDELTATENLVFFGSMHGYSKSKLMKDAVKILQKLGLGDRSDKTRNYSGGMKRRLNVGIALIMNPDIYFMDEPSAGLDPQTKHTVWNYLKELRKAGKTIVLTTHDMVEAELLSDRVYFINEGKIIAEGTPNYLKKTFGEHHKLEIVFKEEKGINKFKGKIESSTFLKKILIDPPRKMCLYFDGGILNFIKLLQEKIVDDTDEIEYITFRETSLEDVFLNLTGRRLEQ